LSPTNAILISGLHIEDNEAALGAGIFLHDGHATLEWNRISYNRSIQGTWQDASGAGLYLNDASAEIRSNTFAFNISDSLASGIYFDSPDTVVVERNIFAHGYGYDAFHWDGEGLEPQFICNDAYGNENSLYGGALGEQTGLGGNISENPNFCGVYYPPEPYSYGLHADSPCLPDYNDCGVLMGAFGADCTVTEVPDPPKTPSLSPNFPNPFNPKTTIAFTLPFRCHVTLTVFDVAGRKVRILREASMDAGKHEAVWDGRDEKGRPAGSGLYFYKLSVDGVERTRKMLMVK